MPQTRKMFAKDGTHSLSDRVDITRTPDQHVSATEVSPVRPSSNDQMAVRDNCRFRLRKRCRPDGEISVAKRSSTLQRRTMSNLSAHEIKNARTPQTFRRWMSADKYVIMFLLALLDLFLFCLRCSLGMHLVVGDIPLNFVCYCSSFQNRHIMRINHEQHAHFWYSDG